MSDRSEWNEGYAYRKYYEPGRLAANDMAKAILLIAERECEPLRRRVEKLRNELAAFDEEYPQTERERTLKGRVLRLSQRIQKVEEVAQKEAVKMKLVVFEPFKKLYMMELERIRKWPKEPGSGMRIIMKA